MRVRRGLLVRARQERGAVAAMVAISLLCLLGMLVLTFDLGRGVALKRNMVNAADAGALAAARECGLANGTAAATDAAEQLVGENNNAADVTDIAFDSEAQCNGAGGDGKRQVTVWARVPQDYFFAQIFGFGQGSVVAQATAEYESGVANPVPLKLDLPLVQECNDGHVAGYEGAECYFAFEKAKTGSQRGWLNLPEGWPIEGEDSNPMDCASQKGGSNDLVDYINNMGGTQEQTASFLPKLWADAPATYVCAAGGVPDTATQAIVSWLKMVADMKITPPPVVYFPVVAPNCPADGCINWITTPPSQAAYPVVGLQAFRVVNAWQGQAARGQDNCNFTRQSSDVFCIHLAVAGPDDTNLGGGVSVRLVD